MMYSYLFKYFIHANCLRVQESGIHDTIIFFCPLWSFSLFVLISICLYWVHRFENANHFKDKKRQESIRKRVFGRHQLPSFLFLLKDIYERLFAQHCFREQKWVNVLSGEKDNLKKNERKKNGKNIDNGDGAAEKLSMILIDNFVVIGDKQ